MQNDFEFQDIHGNVFIISDEGFEDSTSEAPNLSNKEMEMEGPNEWLKVGNQYHPSRDAKIRKVLTPGFYSIGYSQGKYFGIEESLNLDEIYKMPSTVIDRLVNEIDTFWDKKDLFKINKVTHKRGVLLVGKAGTGKSSLINLLSKQIIERKGIVFHVANAGELSMLISFVHQDLRKIQPDTPIVTVIEDIDNIVNQDEHLLLSFLDGEDQIEHNVVVGTSNRIQELNDLIMRPSRFDWVIEIDNPNAENRRFYFTKKGIEGEELDTWTEASEGMSMAHLKEMFISVKLLGNDFDETVDKLKDQDSMVHNITFQPKTSKKNSLGFAISNK